MPIDTLLISASDSIAFTQIIEVECKDDDLRANSLAGPLRDVRETENLESPTRPGLHLAFTVSPAHNLSVTTTILSSRPRKPRSCSPRSGTRLLLKSALIMDSVKKSGSRFGRHRLTLFPNLGDDIQLWIHGVFRTRVTSNLNMSQNCKDCR